MGETMAMTDRKAITESVEYTGRELATLVDATREHLKAALKALAESREPLDSTILDAHRAIHEKACIAYERYSARAYEGDAADGTLYRTCPDFPGVCKEYPADCRGARKEPGSAEFRRISSEPTVSDDLQAQPSTADNHSRDRTDAQPEGGTPNA